MSFTARAVVREFQCPAGDGVSAVAAKAVLNALADRADDDGENAYPAVSRVARETCMDPRTVKRVLAHLDDIGLTIRTGLRPSGAVIRKFGAWYHARRAAMGGGGDMVSGGGGKVSPLRGGRVSPEQSFQRSKNGDRTRSTKKPSAEEPRARVLPSVDQVEREREAMDRLRDEIDSKRRPKAKAAGG